MLALWIIAAHMLGDFVLQTDNMATLKMHDSEIRASHVSVYCIPFAFLAFTPVSAGFWHSVVALVFLWVAHFVTDSGQWASGESWPAKPIVVDQSLHAIQLAVFATILTAGGAA